MSQSSFPTLIVDRFIPALWGLPAGQTINPANFLKFNVAQGKENFPFGASVELCNLVGGGDFTGRDNTNFTSYTQSFGENNCFFGTGCGTAITTGGTNTGVGHFDIMKNITTGSGNCGVGYGTLQSVVSTNNNTALGTSAGASLDGTENICIGAGADIIAGVNNSIMMASPGCELGASNCIQINATTAQINQTTANSCVIAPIRGVTPASTELTLPLTYNTTTKEVQYNSTQANIVVDLSPTTTVLTSNANNRFIYIASATGANQVLQLPDARVTFPSTITIYNNTTNSQNITSFTGTQIRIGAPPNVATHVLPTYSSITLQTNAGAWIRTAAI